MALSIGDQAPSFAAPDQTGALRRLSEFHGKWLVLYFYPKDFTSGCTREACGFRDHYDTIKARAQLVGISSDSVESHAKFSARYNLQFPLLSDPQKKMISAYGAKTGILVRRFTYLISPEGTITTIYKSVNPKIHAAQILKDLDIYAHP